MRELLGLELVALLPVRVQVQRDVVHAHANAVGKQALDQLVTVDLCVIAQAHHVQMPRVQVTDMHRTRRQDQRQVSQSLVIARGNLLAAGLEARQALELVQAHGRGDVGQVVLETGRDDLVVPARHLGGEAIKSIAVDAVQAHDLGARRQRRIARHQHAALTGRHGLVGVEAEHHRIALQRANALPLPGRRQRMGSVFHHFQAVLLCNGVDGVHVHRQTGIVHRHQRLGPRGDGRFNGSGVDVERGRIDVHQPHVGAQVAHHLGGGGEGVRGGDDLVTGADAQGFQRQVQASRGRVDSNRLQAGVAQVIDKGLLEQAGLGAGGDPAGTQGVHHFRDFFLADFGQGKGQEGLRGRS